MKSIIHLFNYANVSQLDNFFNGLSINRTVNAVNKLNELSETEYFTDANKQLLAKKVEECIWRDWGDEPSYKSTEKAVMDAVSIVDSWGLSDWDFDELREVHKRLADLRSFNVPANANGYAELVAKLELVKPIYWNHNKKDEFRLCFKQLKSSQSRRKTCIAMLRKFKKENGV